MKVKPEDFPSDYIAKELAARLFNEMFQKWAKENSVCLHPLAHIRSKLLSWQLHNQTLFCGLCGQLLEVTSVKPISVKVTSPAPRSLSLISDQD